MPPWYSPMRTELVTTLKRQATELLSELERDREPILITQRGVPSAYLVDVETYEAMQRRIQVHRTCAQRTLMRSPTTSH
jgi:prevent-host-death family protein